MLVLSAACAAAEDRLLAKPALAAASNVQWTGVYIGGDIGYAFANDTYTLDPAFFSGAPVTSSNLFASRGFSGGVLVGANVVVTPRWLVGVEADWSWQHIVTDLSSLNFLGAEQPWSASLRGRIGYLATPSTLVYGTAGWAWSKVDMTTTFVGVAPPVLTSSGKSNGWEVGAGIESAIANNWHARLEYLQAFGTAASVDQPSVPSIAEIKPTVGLARLALIYQLSIDGIGAATMPPPVQAAWDGLYIGASIGGAVAYSDLNISSGAAEIKGVGLTGPLLSAFIGANYEFVPRWVIGAEAEIAPSIRSTDLKVGAIEAVRGRFGFLFMPDTLMYLSGGWVGTRFDDLTKNGFLIVPGQTIYGTQIGGGLEVAASDKWHVRFDYQYSIMQKVDVTLPFNPTPAPATAEPRAHAGRIALVRQFGGF